LNYRVGADYVKTQQTFPDGVDATADRKRKFASLDGDADRVIYFYLDENGKFHMLDGDKIATLFAIYIRDEVNTLSGSVDLKIGVVQTAYANGASTRFLQEHMKIEVACVSTGVKYLHHRASEFDIGIYFEANGHGTVLFHDSAIEKLRKLKGEWEKDGNVPKNKKEALERLLNLPDLVNQAIGDSLSDILFVESVLLHKNWDLAKWDSVYQDAPNRLKAQRVQDRYKFKTTDAERKLVEPVGLQAKIDEAVKKYKNARSFVRPSGTEDVVRVYAEAATQIEADALADEVALLVTHS
jgi:phosphoacetylglucosamine mutase